MRAYVDESEGGPTTGGGCTFIIGGYLASVENWAAFSEEWKQTLDMRPLMTSLHFKDVNARGWEDPEFAERLARFYRIIEDTVSMSFYCSVNLDDIELSRNNFPVTLHDLNPYRISFMRLIYRVVKHLPDFGLAGPVEFVFDEHTNEKAIRREWGRILEKMHPFTMDVSDKLLFQNDESVLPLQAADMFVWWKRRRHLEKISGEPRLETPWTANKTIPGFHLELGVEDINEVIWSIPAYTGVASGKFL